MSKRYPIAAAVAVVFLTLVGCTQEEAREPSAIQNPPTRPPNPATPPVEPGALMPPSPAAQEAATPFAAARAIARLKNDQNEVVGLAHFHQEADQIRIEMAVTQIQPGTHQVAIHEVGKCDPPAFASAGEVLDPTNILPNPENVPGVPAGLLGEITAQVGGPIEEVFETDRLRIAGGPNSIFDPDGSALVIHSGNTDDRIACGQIERSLQGEA